MNLLDCEPSAIKGKTFRWSDRPDPSGRIEVWDQPEKGGVYVAGLDCAHGIEGRDKSTICILAKHDEKAGKPARQVCEAEGCWGEEVFHTVAYALLTYYNRAFLLGESQGGGLAVLRTLWSKYGYHKMYYDKSVDRAAEVIGNNPKLGWARKADDVTLTVARESMKQGRVLIRSPRLKDQLRRLQWRTRHKTSEQDGERVGDDKLIVKLKGGGSPDLAMAFMYANYALGQVYHFEEEKPLFPPGSYGAIFKLEEKHPGVFGKPAKSAWVKV